MKKFRTLFLIVLSFVLLLSTIPIEYLTVRAADDNDYTVIKDNIKAPNIVAEKDGVYYSPNTWTGQIGDITIPVPNRKKITSVQVLDSKGKYVKHIYPSTGNTYSIGSIQNIGSVDLKAVTTSPLGYFEWWQTSGNEAVWAFDLDGVRHFRKFTSVTSYPISTGTYQNTRKTETPSANGYTASGKQPSWYKPSTSNHSLVFADEVPGKANVGWESRDIEVKNTTFIGSGLNVDISKLKTVSARVDYNSTNNNAKGYIPSTNILKTVVMNSSDDIIANKNVKVWFSARMGSFGTSYNSDNGLLMMRYYNQWNITLSTTLYKYDTYKVVAYYEDIITNEAELLVEGGLSACLEVGTNFQLVSTILKENGYIWTFLTDTPHEKLEYKSNNTKVATVSNTGLVKNVGEGNATISITYTEGDGSAPITKTKDVFVTKDGICDPPPPPPNGGGGSCSYVISSSSVSGTRNNSFINNITPTGKIESQSGEFNVVDGIPSSEYLRTEATTPEYLFEQKFDQQSGKVVYTITAKKIFVLEWEETTPPAAEGEAPKVEKKSENEEKEVTFTVERDYTYWTVNKFDIWSAYTASFENYALPNGISLMENPSMITASATSSSNVNTHVFPVECPQVVLPTETINGGTSKPTAPDFESEAKGIAESQVDKPNVKNDKAVFKGTTLMTDALTSGGNGPTPSNVPTPSNITLEKNDLLISPTKTNYWQSPSTGLMTYKGIFGLSGPPGQKELNISLNNVTVHTPITLKVSTSDDKEHDQRIEPPKRSTPVNSDSEIAAFVLDRTITVYMPTKGHHRNIQGYGNRDYQKYMNSKQVKFPFDIYSETEGAYYPANTWIDVPVDLQEATFKMPSWVTEGRYDIDYRAFAINAPATSDFGGTEHEANITIPNGTVNGNPSAAHSVKDSVTIDVIGRLYDLEITDITDYNWKNVFRTNDGITPSGITYTVGENGIDGDSLGKNSLLTLPVSHASNPSGIKNMATKLGYTFRFDLKTKGDMQWKDDAIRITPTFYFVDKNGQNRQEVDLYYHDDVNDKYFIKIGSSEDSTYRSVKLNETARNVDNAELTNNALFYYKNADKFGITDLTKDYYESSFGRYYMRNYSKENVETGPYGWQILNWQLRTYINSLPSNAPSSTMIPSEEVVTKKQKWYGEYSLPANTYVVPKNSKIQDAATVSRLNENHPLFLKDGYIIVNFNIETIQDYNLTQPYMSYYNGFYANQWTSLEGGKSSFTDGYGYTFPVAEGDMIYYHADQSSLDDFEASTTH